MKRGGFPPPVFIGEFMQTYEKEQLFSTPFIRWYNRAYLENGGVYLDLTLAGFSAVITGELRVKYRVSEPVYGAWVVDEKQEKVYLEGEGELSFAVEKPTFLTFYKLTEQKDGRIQIVSVAGEFSPLPAPKKELITFYGDSITCAYGVEGEPTAQYEKETQNPLIGFAYTLCKRRNAEHDIFSYSGISVSEKIWVPEYTLGELCFGYSMYNRAPFRPARESDIVVVNIGTNDGCAILENQGTAEGLTKGLTDYCRELRRRHPASVMVLGYGFMDKVPAQAEAVTRVAEILKEESAAPVYAFAFPRDTQGANGHPSWKAQVQGGNLLADFLENIL